MYTFQEKLKAIWKYHKTLKTYALYWFLCTKRTAHIDAITQNFNTDRLLRNISASMKDILPFFDKIYKIRSHSNPTTRMKVLFFITFHIFYNLLFLQLIKFLYYFIQLYYYVRYGSVKLVYFPYCSEKFENVQIFYVKLHQNCHWILAKSAV